MYDINIPLKSKRGRGKASAVLVKSEKAALAAEKIKAELKAKKPIKKIEGVNLDAFEDIETIDGEEEIEEIEEIEEDVIEDIEEIEDEAELDGDDSVLEDDNVGDAAIIDDVEDEEEDEDDEDEDDEEDDEKKPAKKSASVKPTSKSKTPYASKKPAKAAVKKKRK